MKIKISKAWWKESMKILIILLYLPSRKSSKIKKINKINNSIKRLQHQAGALKSKLILNYKLKNKKSIWSNFCLLVTHKLAKAPFVWIMLITHSLKGIFHFNVSYLPTIGVDFRVINKSIEDKTYKLQIWDTAGL